MMKGPYLSCQGHGCVFVCVSIPSPLSRYRDINRKVDLEVYESLSSNCALTEIQTLVWIFATFRNTY